MMDRKTLLVVVAIFVLIIWSEGITAKKKIDNAYQAGYEDGYSAAIERLSE